MKTMILRYQGHDAKITSKNKTGNATCKLIIHTVNCAKHSENYRQDN